MPYRFWGLLDSCLAASEMFNLTGIDITFKTIGAIMLPIALAYLAVA